MLNTGDTVEWGHLAAGDQRYSDGKQYELLGDEVLTALPPPPPPSMPAGEGDLPQHTSPPAGEHISPADVDLQCIIWTLMQDQKMS